MVVGGELCKQIQSNIVSNISLFAIIEQSLNVCSNSFHFLEFHSLPPQATTSSNEAPPAHRLCFSCLVGCLPLCVATKLHDHDRCCWRTFCSLVSLVLYWWIFHYLLPHGYVSIEIKIGIPIYIFLRQTVNSNPRRKNGWRKKLRKKERISLSIQSFPFV